jgi:hypothetical protein
MVAERALMMCALMAGEQNPGHGTPHGARRRTRQCDARSYGYRREFLDAGLVVERLLDNRHFKMVMEFLLRDLKPGIGRPATGLRIRWKERGVFERRAASTLNRWMRWAAEQGHLTRKYDGHTIWYFMPARDEERWDFWWQMAQKLRLQHLFEERR